MSRFWFGRARWLTAAAVCLVTTGVAAGAAVAATSSTSSAPKIYARAQQAMGAYQGVLLTGGGTSYRITHGSFDSFRFDFGATPKGYHRATDHVIVVQRKGRVVEEVDTLSAKGQPSVRFWINQAGTDAYGKVLSSKGCTELFTNNSDSFVNVGSPWAFAQGLAFGAAKETAGKWVIPSTFSVGGGTGHETDTISASTFLWKAMRVAVAGGAYNHDVLTESAFRYERHQRLVGLPQLGRC